MKLVPANLSLLIEKFWYSYNPLRWFLWPFSLLFQVISKFRAFILKTYFQHKFPVPVIVVGNISVGGTGKTPLVISLAQDFQAKGLRVGIVSRGYGAKIKCFPYEITPDDLASEVGDEPLMIAKKTLCPVVISPKRIKAVLYLLKKYACQIIISDDGLQHYAMGRAIEIGIIDAHRKLGNNLCLPAGPLRENHHRLKTLDLLVASGGDMLGAHSMMLKPSQPVHMQSGKKILLENLTMPVAAVAGIAHPNRFFKLLSDLGVSYKPYPLPDHHVFAPNIEFTQPCVIMTEKDAVKCQSFAKDNWYFLPVNAILNQSFWQDLYSHQQLKGLI